MGILQVYTFIILDKCEILPFLLIFQSNLLINDPIRLNWIKKMILGPLGGAGGKL